MTKLMIITLSGLSLILMSGCSREVVGGAALGVGAAGAAYEYSNKESMEDLEDDYEEGRISRDEYERRKDAIEDKSLLY